MSDLVLGLLVLGACLFAGVVVYNRLQERSAQRAVERAFSSPRGDTLLDEPSLRREPVIQQQSSPDERVDYVIELKLARPLAAAVVQEGWRPIEQRFARRVLLAPSGDQAWRAGLQLVSRAGVVAEAELIEFRSEVETLGAKLGATLSAPEMRTALEAAHELDRTCAESDIQVALHVIGKDLDPEFGDHPFQVVRREDGVTLVMDVALTPDLGPSYEAMALAGRRLAAAHNGRLVDDRGNALDERSLAAIAAQLEAVRLTLAGRGIDTGSPLALRLFS
ncbi:MAG TPA: cell division protein ZipA C-terminal FtsZ-binding domain-containing protein [Burkholderiales bacterium]|nr:cell division protein ZipA C-terminal FtsZ-binding domain-containing protein [Burkholderiales bacterium]